MSLANVFVAIRIGISCLLWGAPCCHVGVHCRVGAIDVVAFLSSCTPHGPTCQSGCFPHNFDVMGVFGYWASLLDASVATMVWHLWVVVLA